MKWLCLFLSHRWRWYVPNCEHTIIGTQYCTRCGAMRGVRVKPNQIHWTE